MCWCEDVAVDAIGTRGNESRCFKSIRRFKKSKSEKAFIGRLIHHNGGQKFEKSHHIRDRLSCPIGSINWVTVAFLAFGAVLNLQRTKL